MKRRKPIRNEDDGERSSPADKPVFILGVGAQKAGTTFLYSALDNHAGVAMSPLKEMHVFDTVFRPAQSTAFDKARREGLIQLLQTAPGEQTAQDKARTINHLRLCMMNYDLREYVRYFRKLARKKNARYTGEITPAYMLLSAKHFQSVRTLLAPHFNIRVIFLLRDPIERALSALSMDDRAQGHTDNLAHERFAKVFRQGHTAIKSQYERTITALDEAFARDQVHYEFYEDLFNERAFAGIAGFLGLDGLTADFGERVNASPERGQLDADTIAQAREFFAPTYDFCMARFGEARVRALWKHC